MGGSATSFTEKDAADLVSTREYLKKNRDMNAMPEVEDAIIRDFGDKAQGAL